MQRDVGASWIGNRSASDRHCEANPRSPDGCSVLGLTSGAELFQLLIDLDASIFRPSESDFFIFRGRSHRSPKDPNLSETPRSIPDRINIINRHDRTRRQPNVTRSPSAESCHLLRSMLQAHDDPSPALSRPTVTETRLRLPTKSVCDEAIAFLLQLVVRKQTSLLGLRFATPSLAERVTC